MRLRRLIIGSLAFAGCSASDEPRADAMPVDPGHVRFESACAPTTSLTFPETEHGQKSSIVVSVINDGDTEVNLGTLQQVLTIDGADATEFEIHDSQSPSPLNLSTCTNTASLAPGAWCQVTISFVPFSLGTKQASYVFGNGAGTLDLVGSAVSPRAVLHAERVNVVTGFLPTDTGSFLLRNDSPETVQLGDLMVSPPFQSYPDTVGDYCPTTLTPGGACTLLILASTAQTECITGALTASQTSFSLPLSYTPALPFPTRFIVRPVGNGVGTVTAADGPISCTLGEAEGVCSEEVWGAARPIELVATPDAGSELVGWMTFDSLLLPCGNSASCVVQSLEPSRLGSAGVVTQVWFAPLSEKRIQVNVVGSGRVAVDGLVSSDFSFSFRVPSGRAVSLRQIAAGSFVGWSGDCTGTSEICSLGTIINDRTVTATFSP